MITEIDIGRQARALAWLRLTDYALVVLCGFWVLRITAGTLSELLLGFSSIDLWTFAFVLTALAVLCFAVYTGWRHVGVIDPAVWRVYGIVFPVLVVFCLLVVWSGLGTSRSLARIMEQERSEAIQQLSGLVIALWIGGVSLLGWISLHLLRRMKITALGGTVVHVLERLAKHAGVSAMQATKIRRINTPRGLAIGAAGVLILLAFNVAPVPSDKVLAEAYFRNAQMITMLGFFLLVRARRFFQIDADSLLAVDRRPPILFLRSFDDDEKQTFGSSQTAFLDFSLETRLSNHFFHFGPFIAVGSPKETVPQLGAARVLLRDDEWQERVLGWMNEASVIIMYSGTTQWVNWELRQIIERGRATNLILMFPEIKGWRPSRRRKNIVARVEKIREVFKDTPWNEELMAFSDFTGLRAMLFRADGSMVMVRSRSLSRDAYHLAALVAHQQLLEPGAVTQSAADDARQRRRSWVATGGVLVSVVASIGALYLFMHAGDSLLMFKRGEVYYGEGVSAAEARSVGEHLVQQQFFSDERDATVQLHQESGRYRLRFVIKTDYAEDPLAAIQYGILGSRIGRDVLGGRPVEVGFLDSNLRQIKIVPLSALMEFGKGELYYSEPVTTAQARAVGELLKQSGFFGEESAVSVGLSQEDGAVQLKFVIDPSHQDDPEIRSGFRMLSLGITREALGGHPVVFHLCDDHFRTLFSERL